MLHLNRCTISFNRLFVLIEPLINPYRLEGYIYTIYTYMYSRYSYIYVSIDAQEIQLATFIRASYNANRRYRLNKTLLTYRYLLH